MDSGTTQILNLPDEVLYLVLKKLNNVNVLCSLVGIHDRLDRLAYDVNFTQTINLTTVSPNGSHKSLADDIVHRFCSVILPRICVNVKSLIVQAKIFEDVLRTKNYPNLQMLTLHNLQHKVAARIFTKNSSFVRYYKHQITRLVITINDRFGMRSVETIICRTYVAIIMWFSRLRHLSVDGGDGSYYSRRLLRGLSPSRCYSSGIVFLSIDIKDLDDCLCLLDGRLSQLETLLVKIHQVRYSRIIINNESTLLKLKCFSMKICRPTLDFHDKVVPILRRMSNLEKLTLCCRIRRQNSFIDGHYLTNEITRHMARLHEFMFDIISIESRIIAYPLPCSDDIRRTFVENGYHADCYVEYCNIGIGRCHIYSLPFTMDRIQCITSRFTGGMFMNVRFLRLADFDHSFENAFFALIARSFPSLRILSLSNTVKLIQKPFYRAKKSRYTCSAIEFSQLVELSFVAVHIDYVEQLLSCLNTRLPSLDVLRIQYNQLATATEYFTREDTRVNCSNIKYLLFRRWSTPCTSKRLLSSFSFSLENVLFVYN